MNFFPSRLLRFLFAPRWAFIYLFFLMGGSAGAQMVTVQPKLKVDGLLRNPATGWMLYLETFGMPTFPSAEKYWSDNAPYLSVSSILYIRCTWTQMEPQEGHYAWKEDANFQALVKGAQERGIKLSFRVVANSKDCVRQATPAWVQDAGAQGYMEKGKGGVSLWTGSPTDPIFRKKLEDFVTAFAEEFDDPSRVDYIDGCGLGWWGEMHHLNPGNTTTDEENRDIFNWSLGTYANAFHHVLLALLVDSPLGLRGQLDSEGYTKYGYIGRIDHLGSTKWYVPAHRKMVAGLYPTIPFIGEVCWLPNDPQQARPILEAGYQDAMAAHTDILSLRQPAVWINGARDLVDAFIAHGGYRFYPSSLNFPSRFSAQGPVAIQSIWQNVGGGVFPNDNVRWNKKYRVAFALLDPLSKAVVAIAVDRETDPGTWLAGQPSTESLNASFLPAPAPGDYGLAVALVDTTFGNKPSINLAIADLPESNGWTLLGHVHVDQ